MRAISLWQPWATLIAIGSKRYETRSWGTSYRGPLALHAAKTKSELDRCDWPEFQPALEKAGLKSGDLPLGAILGIVHLDGCLRIAGTVVGGGRVKAPYGIDPRGLPAAELAFGNWEAGRFAWHIASVIRFVEPIPYRGEQGLFEVPGAVMAQGRAAE